MLVKNAAAGDQDAWDALVARYNNLLWSVARGYRLERSDAADVVQIAWLRLVEHLPKVRDPERVGAWLATTVRRECLQVIARSAPGLAGGRRDPGRHPGPGAAGRRGPAREGAGDRAVVGVRGDRAALPESCCAC